MDFANLLNVANQNVASSKESQKCYKSRLAPPKKEPKDKKLSDNIKKFLQKRELEEKEKQQKKEEERKALMAKRDVKQTNKINKMLKVIKSANKSVIADAIDEKDTAITLQGPAQPDEDDYGYVSHEASAYYSKIMQKYNANSPAEQLNNKKDKMRHDNKTLQEKLERTKKDMDERKEKEPIHRSRSTKPSMVTSNSKQEFSRCEPGNSKDVTQKAHKKNFKPAPLMSFNDILKLAEKKQHEEIIVPVKSKDEPNRLMTKKQREEEQERLAFIKRRKERSINMNNNNSTKNSAAKDKQEEYTAKSQSSKLYSALTKPTELKPAEPKAEPKQKQLVKDVSKPLPSPTSSKAQQMSKQVTEKRPIPLQKQPILTERKTPVQLNKSRPQQNNRSTNYSNSNNNMHKRRIEDTDDEEYGSEDYDSEMDDFIDDEGAEDVSSFIKDIFGYDRRKYKDEDFDDRMMESSYAQQMKEEQMSKKIGMMEDLEDMKQEEKEKKIKAQRKKQKVK